MLLYIYSMMMNYMYMLCNYFVGLQYMYILYNHCVELFVSTHCYYSHYLIIVACNTICNICNTDTVTSIITPSRKYGRLRYRVLKRMTPPMCLHNIYSLDNVRDVSDGSVIISC